VVAIGLEKVFALVGQISQPFGHVLELMEAPFAISHRITTVDELLIR
jgi:hypothetical protein